MQKIFCLDIPYKIKIQNSYALYFNLVLIVYTFAF